MKTALTVTILLGMSATAVPLAFAGGQVGNNSQGDGSVQAAIRFEKAKDAADARQAANPQLGPQLNSAAVANERAGNVKDSGVQEAIRFERSKDAADARQARIDAGQAADNATVGNADRRMTSHKQ